MSHDFPRNLRHERPRRDAAAWSGGMLAAWLLALILLTAVVGGWLFYRSQLVRLRRAEMTAAVAREKAQQIQAARLSAQQQGDAIVISGPGPASSEVVVADADERLLWASPTAGPPISLAYAPPGAQCFIHLRPAQLAEHPEGEKALAALGPWGRDALEGLKTRTAATTEEIQFLLVSIVALPGGKLDACLRADLKSTWNEAESWRRLPAGDARRHGNQEWRATGDRAWFLLPDRGAGANRTLVECPIAMAPELIDSAGQQPLVTRDLESLVARSDALRTATLIVAPNFLQSGGRRLLDGAAESLGESLATLVGRDATAVAISVHWGDSFFAELRATPALTVPPRYLAASIGKRLDASADQVTSLLAEAPPTSHAATVLSRFPDMLRRLASSTRSGEIEKQAVLRSYLPAVAGHNLLMGVELVLTQTGPPAG
jgi:hypothetical protein